MAHQLPTADRIEVTVLVDNVTDMFTPPATAVDRRLPLSLTRTLLAEHGLSCLIRIFSEGKVHEVLMDAGLSDICLLHNARELDCDLTGIDAVVLSHGHPDHTGSLCAFFRSTGRTIPLVLHPDAFLQRRLNMPDGPVNLPQLDAAALKDAGAAIQAREHASTLAAGHLLLTGQVPRTTAFERGMPGAEAYINNEWVADPIRDDQGLVIHVKDKGLVVISGCAHAGIINTVEYARQLTGIDRVHAVPPLRHGLRADRRPHHRCHAADQPRLCRPDALHGLVRDQPVHGCDAGAVHPEHGRDHLRVLNRGPQLHSPSSSGQDHGNDHRRLYFRNV
jgi:7,8-dihydropterin-6-yl-methyl-4-(beta-D-ribofuranosyl)aminobenzene 5'-phosphate synthase